MCNRYFRPQLLEQPIFKACLFVCKSHVVVVVNVIYCDNNFMVIGKENVFQIISHNYTTYKIGYKIIQ